jgi:putative redox protein
MATESAHRSVRLERVQTGRYTAVNARGGQISVSSGDGTDFTPVELLLVAMGGCTAADVDFITARRAEPDHFEVLVDAEKVRDEHGNHLTDLVMTFRVTFPDGEAGEAARVMLPDAVKKSHDRLCTVSRTIELGTPIATRIETGRWRAGG